MVTTRRFTNEEQQILENFIRSGEVYNLINDTIFDDKELKKWAIDNSKIIDTISKYLNRKNNYSLDHKDKFLSILLDVINCQLEEKTNHNYKEISLLPKLKDFFIALGSYAEIEGMVKAVDVSSLNNYENLEKNVQKFLNEYNPKSTFYLAKLNSAIKKIDEEYKKPFFNYNVNNEEKSLLTLFKEVMQEEYIFSDKELVEIFNLLVEVIQLTFRINFPDCDMSYPCSNENHQIDKKRKYEDIEEDNHSKPHMKKLAGSETFEYNLKCIGETILDSE